MLKIDKNQPTFFAELVKNRKKWEEFKDKKRLNEFLLKEQEYMCVYCESKIIKEFHIDHFYKRDLFPNLTFDYNNLFISCNDENHSAKYKDKFGLKKEEFANIYSPLDIKLNEFEYSWTGEILGKTQKAQKTIEVFNLNNNILIQKRSKIIKQLYSYQNLDFNIFECFGEFKTFLDFYKNNLL